MALGESEIPILDTYQAVVSAFGSFLKVAIHTILYERHIYPSATFMKVRAYDFPVAQSRHPSVCKWISDAVAAVEAELLKCSVARTCLVIHEPPPLCRPVERYVFSTLDFPRIAASEIQTPFTSGPLPTDSRTPSPSPNPEPLKSASSKLYPPPPSRQNLPEQFRATLARLIPAISRLPVLPNQRPDIPLSEFATHPDSASLEEREYTYTLAIELHDDPDVEAPLYYGNNDPWIPVQPDEQKCLSRDERQAMQDQTKPMDQATRRQREGKYLRPARSRPVRTVEAGAFAMEVWIEQGSQDDVQSFTTSTNGAPAAAIPSGMSTSPTQQKSKGKRPQIADVDETVSQSRYQKSSAVEEEDESYYGSSL